MKQFELAIIGGGPGGYVAAIRAAKLGLSVAVVEGRDLGGTCLNRGCIPSKTLLQHAKIIDQIKDANMYGIHVNDYTVSIQEMVDRKTKVVNQLKNGINSLLRQNKITIYQGYGHVSSNKQITIQSDKDTHTISAEKIILANGSKPFTPKIPGIENAGIHTSDTIFDITEIPKHMVIIGGGVIGLEIATIFNSLETKVEIIEMADQILPSEDPDAAQFLAKTLTKNGVKIHTNTKLTKFKQQDTRPIIEIEKNGKKMELSPDNILVAVGRIPNPIGLENLALSYDGRFVKVSSNMETSIPGIYAIGDMIGGYQLAHAASDEGIRAVNHIIGNPNKKESIIPRCVYTFPEIASVGLTEAEAREKGYNVKVKKVDLAGNGKAIAAGENSGFMKIIADETYGEILGVAMVGSHVTEMISQATSFMHLEGTVEEIESMVYPHPTIAESLFEAAGAWLGKGIHYT